MPKSKLQPIPDPLLSRSTVLRTGEGTVLFRGPNTGLRYACGTCGAPLVDCVPAKYLVDLVLACNACGGYNASAGVDTARGRMTDVTGVIALPPGRHIVAEPMRVPDRCVIASEQALRTNPIAMPNERPRPL
jgi:hypothetical protein